MNRSKRRRFFVDGKVQGVLMRRAVCYWFLFVVSLALMSALWMAMSSGPMNSRQLFVHMWSAFGPALAASVMLLPIVLIDSVRLSNRFAGPMFRLRASMRKACQGEQVAPVKFRDGDYWSEFADDFNQLVSLAQARNDVFEQTVEDRELDQQLDEVLTTAQC